MALEPSAYWLPHNNKKGRSNTNVWQVKLEMKEYVLMKSFAATDPIDIDAIKQVKCNCYLDTHYGMGHKKVPSLCVTTIVQRKFCVPCLCSLRCKNVRAFFVASFFL